MNFNEKNDFITSFRFFKELNEQELIKIVLKEENSKLLRLIVNGIKNQGEFRKKYDISTFIKKLPEINKNKEFLFTIIIKTLEIGFIGTIDGINSLLPIILWFPLF